MLRSDHRLLQDLRDLILRIPTIAEQDTKARTDLLLFGLPRRLVHQVEPHHDPEVHVARIVSECDTWGLVGSGKSKRELALLVLVDNVSRQVVDLPDLQLELKDIQTRLQTLAQIPTPGLEVAAHIPVDESLLPFLQSFPYAGIVWQIISGYTSAPCLLANLALDPVSPSVFCVVKIDSYRNLEIEYNNYCTIGEQGVAPGFLALPVSPPAPLQAGYAALIGRIPSPSSSATGLPLQQLLRQGRHRAAFSQLQTLVELWLEWNPLNTPVRRGLAEVLRDAVAIGGPDLRDSIDGLEASLNKCLFRISHPGSSAPEPWLQFEDIAEYLPNPIAHLSEFNYWGTAESVPFLVGQAHGSLHTGNIIASIDRDTGHVTNDGSPFVVDLELYMSYGCYTFDWAYLELDILHQFISFESGSDWARWIDIVDQMTSAYHLTPEYTGSFGGSVRDAYACVHRLREMWIARFLEDDLFYQVLVQNFWLAGVAAGLRYIQHQDQTSERRAASLYYSSRCLSRLLPASPSRGQRAQFVPIHASSQERFYLEGLMQAHQVWKELYVSLGGDKQTPIRQRSVLKDAARQLFSSNGTDLRGDVVVRNGQLLSEPIAVEKIDETIAALQQVVLLGSPGSGKTTTLRWLAYRYAEQALEDPDAPLPILVALGGWATDKPLVDYVAQSFGNLETRLGQYVSNSGSRGIVLLLDALNEMPRTHVPEIRRLLWRAPFPFVVSCRTLDYQNDLQDLENLSVVRIQELDPKRIWNFINKYVEEESALSLFEQIGGNAALLRTVDLFEMTNTIQNFWNAVYWSDIPWEYGTTDDPLLNAYLELYGNQRSLIWLARNPYMLRMIVEVYDIRSANMPRNRGELFQDFVQLLVERAYSAGEEGTGCITSELLLGGLSELAFAMQTTDERTQVEYHRAEAHLRQRFPEVDVSLFLQVAHRAYFIDIHQQYIHFRHQLLQEYFAAQILRQAIDQGQNAEYFWKSDSWWLPTGWEVTTILLTGVHESPEKIIDWLQAANPELARLCITESDATFSERTADQFRSFLQTFVQDESKSALSRAYAAQTLGRMKDERPGISTKSAVPSIVLNPLISPKVDILPDILWIAVPAIDDFQLGLSEQEAQALTKRHQEDDDRFDYEVPASLHKVKPFWISCYPITNAQFAPFVGNGEAYDDATLWTEAGNAWRRSIRPFIASDPFSLSNCPVVYISWYEAVAYTNWLSAKLGLPIRLPNELEWEVAASFDPSTKDKLLHLEGGENGFPRCNSSELGFPYPSMVTLFPKGASPLGICDIAGNVWEWCSTVWQTDWEDSRTRVSYPYDHNDGREELEYARAKRVIRGGCYLDSLTSIRTTMRKGASASSRLGGIGFRVVTDKNPYSYH